MLPIRTSIVPRKTPYLNYALIIINVFFFLITYWNREYIVDGQRVSQTLRDWAQGYMLTPVRPYLWQFVTYAFLHGSLMHIFGNMFFLYIFGNNVNDRLGNVGYLCLYLGGGVAAGVGHAFLHTTPVLGASGAVAAITGAYLVLFPKTLITVVYWFFLIGTMELPALYFILFKLIVWDNVVEPKFSHAAVAYDAHLAGYAFGAVAMLLLLGTGVITSSGYDMWAMIKQWNRRRRYRDAVSGGYDPFAGKVKAKYVKSKQAAKSPEDIERDKKTLEIRNEIGKRVTERNLSAAAELYQKLIEIDSSQVPPRQYLLDIANQLASENKHVDSARAYEVFLTNYANYEYIEQVQLMAGIIYSRYLHQPEMAIKRLQAACGKLTDPGQLKMCEDELKKLQH